MRKVSTLIKSSLILMISVNFTNLSGKIIDKYGIIFGSGFSTQVRSGEEWLISNVRYNTGISAQIFGEKSVNQHLNLRISLGYIRKGFRYTADFSEVLIKDVDYQFIMHDVSLDFNSKILFAKELYVPYLLVGIRSDFLLSHEDKPVNDDSKTRIAFYEFDRFNKLTFGALIGFGWEFKELVFFDLQKILMRMIKK